MRTKHQSPYTPYAFAPALRRRQWVTSIKVTLPTPRVSSEDLAWLHAHYEFRREQEVVEYLQTYPFLIEVLKAATTAIPQYFGNETKLVLEVVTDHEYPTDRELCVWLYSPLNRREARRRMDELSDGWWLDAMSRTELRMSMMLGDW